MTYLETMNMILQLGLHGHLMDHDRLEFWTGTRIIGFARVENKVVASYEKRVTNGQYEFEPVNDFSGLFQ